MVTRLRSRGDKGTLLWDAGAVPDTAWQSTGESVKHRLTLSNGATRELTLRKALRAQLAEADHSVADVTFLALSHYHYDHTANANAFPAATWLVRQHERDAMFADPPPEVTLPSTYAALRTGRTRIIDRDDYDVFGDGTVVIKAAPGHTRFHQVLDVKLAKTGGIVLSGDLYHYEAARKLNRLPIYHSLITIESLTYRVLLDSLALPPNAPRILTKRSNAPTPGLQRLADFGQALQGANVPVSSLFAHYRSTRVPCEWVPLVGAVLVGEGPATLRVDADEYRNPSLIASRPSQAGATANRPKAIGAKLSGGILRRPTQRKFSTNMRSLAGLSILVKTIVRPSGETARPNLTRSPSGDVPIAVEN